MSRRRAWRVALSLVLASTFLLLARRALATTPNRWYALDDGSGTTAVDSGSDAQNCTGGSFPQAWTSGQIGGAAKITSAGQNCTASAATLLGDFTICFWEKIDGTNNINQNLIPARSSSMSINHFASVPRFFNATDSCDEIVASAVATRNAWEHYCFVRSSSTWKLYLNGTQDSSASTACGEAALTRSLSFTDLLYGITGDPLELDNFKLWQSALSDSDISDEYNGVTDTSTPTNSPTATDTPTGTPTATNTATATSTETPTNTATPIRTATFPPTSTATFTPTTTSFPCAGDCNGSGEVTVNEVIQMVNIALGTAQPSACAHGVPTGASVDVSLIVRAVNNALNGCP